MERLRLSKLLICTGIFLAACTTSKSSNKSSASTSTNLSQGCNNAGSPTTGTFHVAGVDGNGTARDYEVIVPTTYTSSTPMKLTFLYHGHNGTEAQAIAYNVQAAPGASAAGIFVFPQGIDYYGQGVGWDDTCGGYDVPFFDNMVTYIENTYCVDKTKVFAGGFSWGCDHVTALTCCRGNELKAVSGASCSDEYSNPANYLTYNNATCASNTNVGIRFTHSTTSDGAYTLQEFNTTSDLYRSFNTCSATSTAVSPSPCVSYNNCASPVIECAYPGLGHATPANWGNDTWSFFSTF